MFPTPEMQSNLAFMHQRDPQTGAIAHRDHILRRACFQTTKEAQDCFFHSGGAGLWTRMPEYVKVLGALLNDGASPTTGNRILTKETVDMMWENQIPDQYVVSSPPPLIHHHPPPLSPHAADPTDIRQAQLRPRRPAPLESPACQRDLRDVPAGRQSAAGLGPQHVSYYRAGHDGARREYGVLGRAGELLLVGG